MRSPRGHQGRGIEEVKEAGFSVRCNARNSMQRVAVRALPRFCKGALSCGVTP
jgi:hypothetical protein